MDATRASVGVVVGSASCWLNTVKLKSWCARPSSVPRKAIVVDGVFSEDLMIRSLDSSSFSLTSRRFGPAGLLRLQLSDGIVIGVDAAKPGQLAFLDVGVASTGDPLMSELIGGGGTEKLSVLTPSLGSRPRRIQRSRESSTAAFRGSVPDPGDVAEFVGEVIRLVVMAESSAKSPIVRMVAALEVARRLRDVEQFPRLGVLFRARAQQAVRLLARDSRSLLDGFHDLDQDLRERVVALLDRSRKTFPEVEELWNGTYSTPKISNSRVGSRVSSTSSFSRNRDRPPRIVTVIRRERNWVTLKFDVHKKNYWVRVIDGRTQQLVSLVPVKSEPRRGSVADILIPIDHLDSELAFEVTVSPLPVSDDPIQGHLNGVRLGLKAVDMNIRGCRDEARVLWLACAEQWAKVGDLQRSRLALDYARQGIARRFRTLADRIDTSSHFEP